MNTKRIALITALVLTTSVYAETQDEAAARAKVQWAQREKINKIRAPIVAKYKPKIDALIKAENDEIAAAMKAAK